MRSTYQYFGFGLLLVALLGILIKCHSWLEQDVLRFLWFFTLLAPLIYWLLNRSEKPLIEIPISNTSISLPRSYATLAVAIFTAYTAIQTPYGKLATQDLLIKIINDQACFDDYEAKDFSIKINGSVRHDHQIERGHIIVPLDQDFIGDLIVVHVDFKKGNCYYLGEDELCIELPTILINPKINLPLVFDCSAALTPFNEELKSLERILKYSGTLNPKQWEVLLQSQEEFNALGKDTISGFHPYCKEDFEQQAIAYCQFLRQAGMDVKCKSI